MPCSLVDALLVSWLLPSPFCPVSLLSSGYPLLSSRCPRASISPTLPALENDPLKGFRFFHQSPCSCLFIQGSRPPCPFIYATFSIWAYFSNLKTGETFSKMSAEMYQVTRCQTLKESIFIITDMWTSTPYQFILFGRHSGCNFHRFSDPAGDWQNSIF
jgi:hypothetical protein